MWAGLYGIGLHKHTDKEITSFAEHKRSFLFKNSAYGTTDLLSEAR